MGSVPFLLRPLVWFVLCLVYAPVGIAALLCFAIGHSFRVFFHERAFAIQMRQNGRFLTQSELCDKIKSSKSGTLIIEHPSHGWNFSHAWWTPDTVNADPTRMSKENSGAMCTEWDRMVWNNYLQPENGSAYLLRVWNGKSIRRELRHRFPSMNVVFICSAYVHFDEWFLQPET